jgi:Holliday junction resolvase RusA-like endonuclease
MGTNYLLVLDIPPKAKKNPLRSRQGGMFTKKEDREWRAECTRLVQEQWGDREPLKGPLRANIMFFMKRPKAAKPWEIWHSKRPDRDNLLKNLGDCLQAGGAILDDSQICTGNVEKLLAAPDEEPRIVVELSCLGSSVVECP